MTLAFYIIWIAAAATCLWVSQAQTIDDVMWWHLRTVTPVTMILLLIIGHQAVREYLERKKTATKNQPKP